MKYYSNHVKQVNNINKYKFSFSKLWFKKILQAIFFWIFFLCFLQNNYTSDTTTTVSSTSPTTGATDVAVASNITATFGEERYPATIQHCHI